MATTRLGLSALSTQEYGSFSGKTEEVVDVIMRKTLTMIGTRSGKRSPHNSAIKG